MTRRGFVLVVACLLSDSVQKCSHPQAEEGHQVIEGCLLRTCEANGWRSSLVSNICCYERKPFTMNTTISSIMSEDGCAKASLDCVKRSPGKAKMVLNVENYCKDYASNEQLEEIKNIVAECEEENAEIKDEKEVLFIGPGWDSDGKSEVMSLPDLTPLDYNLPVYPAGEVSGYVGRYTSDGIHMCGGGIGSFSTASCYLLTSRGYEDMPRMMTQRGSAASIETPLGWWVTGGYDLGFENLYSTELWTNNQWKEHVSLPEPMEGHCMTRVNQSHILITGGGTTPKWNRRSSSSYLYSEETGFTKIGDMKIPRNGHGCSVINGNEVLVAGGGANSETETEYLDLETLTWSAGPELPTNLTDIAMTGAFLMGKDKIFKLEESGLSSDRQWQWVESGKIKTPRRWSRLFVIEKKFLDQMETGSDDKDEKKGIWLDTDPKFLLTGPHDFQPYGKSEVLRLRDLTTLDCNLPVWEYGYWDDYVGRSTSDGIHMCGGLNFYDPDSCYLLTTRGYENMPRPLTNRRGASSVETPFGWWVTGGYGWLDEPLSTELDSTELWSNNQWKEHVRLPEPMIGHCMTLLNQSHILITGGDAGEGALTSSYLYSEEKGFTKIEDMKTPRIWHGCSVINDKMFVAGGAGGGIKTEYLDLTTLTWSPGPELPSPVSGKLILPKSVSGRTKIIGSLLMVGNKIFKLVELGTSGLRQWEWVKVGELKKRDLWNKKKNLFNSFVISDEFCN